MQKEYIQGKPVSAKILPGKQEISLKGLKIQTKPTNRHILDTIRYLNIYWA